MAFASSRMMEIILVLFFAAFVCAEIPTKPKAIPNVHRHVDDDDSLFPDYLPPNSGRLPQHYFAPEVSRLYGFPSSNYPGSRPNIALVELCDDYVSKCGFVQADLETYWDAIAVNWTNLGYPATTQRPVITQVFVYDQMSEISGTNTPTGENSDEIVLDIEVVTGLVPNFDVDVTVYFTPNTNQGEYNGIKAAIDSGKHSAISLSWGGPEWFNTAIAGCFVYTSSGTSGSLVDCPSAYTDLLASAAEKGISFFVSSGDSGAVDNLFNLPVSIDFPTSNPYAISVGGTSLWFTPNNADPLSYDYGNADEVTWNSRCHGCPADFPCNASSYDPAVECGSGGGYSILYLPTPWQEDAVAGYMIPGTEYLGSQTAYPTLGVFSSRGIPDVAGLADPRTGWRIFGTFQVGCGNDTLHTGWFTYGGTSASAPMWATLWGMLNGQSQPWFYAGTVLYANPEVLYDITHGDNYDAAQNGYGPAGYNATVGYDLVTGLGTPNGARLISLFSQLKATSPSNALFPSFILSCFLMITFTLLFILI